MEPAPEQAPRSAVRAPGRFHGGEPAGAALLAERLVEHGVWDCRFGVADEAIHAQMRDFGFAPARYDVPARSLTDLPGDGWNRGGGNTLYVRDLEECRQRVGRAAKFRLVNCEI